MVIQKVGSFYCVKPHLVLFKFVQVVGLSEPAVPRVPHLPVDGDVDIGVGPGPPQRPSEHMDFIGIYCGGWITKRGTI